MNHITSHRAILGGVACAAASGFIISIVTAKTPPTLIAIDYSCRPLNSAHGQPETPKDRKRRIVSYIQRHKGDSNVKIGDWCGCDEGTVRNYKKELPPSETSEPEKVAGRDGKQYPSSKPRKEKHPTLHDHPGQLHRPVPRPRGEPAHPGRLKLDAAGANQRQHTIDSEASSIPITPRACGELPTRSRIEP